MERPLEPTLSGIAELTLRRPTEQDHAQLSDLVRGWWDERPPRLERLWFRHFASSSIVAETTAGRLVGLGIGFRSADDPGSAVLQLVAVARDKRRQGLGRAIAATIEERLNGAGATRIEAAAWPGNRSSIRFLEALGYAFTPELLETRLYGIPAIADYDGDGEDRAILTRALPRRPAAEADAAATVSSPGSPSPR